MQNIKKLMANRFFLIGIFIAIVVVAGGVAAFIFSSDPIQSDSKVVEDLVPFNSTQVSKAALNANMTNALTQSSKNSIEPEILIENSANRTSETGISTPMRETRVEATKDNSAENSTSEGKKNDLTEKIMTPLRYFTSLRSELEMKKLEVAIAEQNKKLIELHTPNPAVVKAIQQKPAGKRHYRPVWPKIVSIQGVDGRLSATLSSSDGVQTVKAGSNAGPGKVVSITPTNVLIRFNGKNVPLKFKE